MQARMIAAANQPRKIGSNMGASLSGVFNLQEFTDLGLLGAGMRLYTYVPATTTQKIAYTDAAGTIPQTYTNDGLGGQYIALNSRGELPAPLFLLAGGYDVTLKTALGVTVWTRRAAGGDDAAVAGITTLLASLISSIGASLIGFIQAGANAVLRTIQDELRLNMNVMQFGAKGDGATDDTAAIQAALNAMSAAGGGIVTAPPKRYRLTSKLTIPSWVKLQGLNWQPTAVNGSEPVAMLLIDWGAGADNHAVEMSYSSAIEGFQFYYPGQVDKNLTYNGTTYTAPFTFGFSISTPTAAGIYDNIQVKNIMLFNSYKGIRLNNGGRWHVDNIQGEPLMVGFSSSDCFDVCYMNNVHLWPFYTAQDYVNPTAIPLGAWKYNNGTAFQFFRIDQLFASKMFALGYQNGFDCKTNLWANFTDILTDTCVHPFTQVLSSRVRVSNFEFVGSPNIYPAIWYEDGGVLELVNGYIPNNSSVGVQIGGSSGTVLIDNVTFENKVTPVVSTGLLVNVKIGNCRWSVPPLGSSNVTIDGWSLPAVSTAVTLPAPLVTPASAISGGYAFNLSSVITENLQWETTYISERNSLYVLSFTYELPTVTTAWSYSISVATDTGASTQVSIAPTYPLILNTTVSQPTRTVYVPFFINHGRFRQVLNIKIACAAGVAGASLKVTNIGLYEQANKLTTDAQVSMMMTHGYNLDAYSMGQTLMAKGKNRIVITQPESGIGRPTEVPIAGTWDVGDEVRVFNPVPAGYESYICTTAGTPGTWKGNGQIQA